MSEKDRIQAFLVWFDKSSMVSNMKFAFGTYLFIAIAVFVLCFLDQVESNITVGILLGIFGAAFWVWYFIAKSGFNSKISQSYFYCGAVFAASAVIAVGGSALVMINSKIRFGLAHTIAAAVGIVLLLFVFFKRLSQYRSPKRHEVKAGFAFAAVPIVIAVRLMIDRVTENVGRDYLCTVIFVLMGCILAVFSLIFLINFYVARRHDMDEFYYEGLK